MLSVAKFSSLRNFLAAVLPLLVVPLLVMFVPLVGKTLPKQNVPYLKSMNKNSLGDRETISERRRILIIDMNLTRSNLFTSKKLLRR